MPIDPPIMNWRVYALRKSRKVVAAQRDTPQSSGCCTPDFDRFPPPWLVDQGFGSAIAPGLQCFSVEDAWSPETLEVGSARCREPIAAVLTRRLLGGQRRPTIAGVNARSGEALERLCAPEGAGASRTTPLVGDLERAPSYEIAARRGGGSLLVWQTKPFAKLRFPSPDFSFDAREFRRGIGMSILPRVQLR